MSKHQLGGVVLAVAAAMLTVLNFNGLSPMVRGLLSVFFTIVFLLGLACFNDLLPPKYRGRSWAVRRLAELHFERESAEEPADLLLIDESDIEAFDMRPGAQNYGAMNTASSREDLGRRRKTEMEIAELTGRLKRPTPRAWLSGMLAEWMGRKS